MTMTSTEERKSLLSLSDEKGGLNVKEISEYKEISNYCVEKTSNLSPLNDIDPDAPTFDGASDIGLDLVKENIANTFDNKRDIQQLASKGQVLRTPSEQVGGGDKARASVPDKKYVFQAKENFEGKRNIDSSKKKKKKKKKKEQDVEGKIVFRQKLAESEKLIEGLQDELKKKDEQLLKGQTVAFEKDKELEEMSDLSVDSSKKKKKKEKGVEGKIVLRQKLAKSQEHIVGLQNELKQKDEQLLKRQTVAVEKDEELEEMSDFMTTLQDLLQEMAMSTDAEQLDISVDMANLSSSKKPSDAAANAGEVENSDALEVTSKEHEKEATIPQLLKSLASQESLIESLNSLNVDSVNSSSSKKPSDAAAKAREDENSYALEVTSKEHKNEATIPRLLESLESRESLIESLNSLNVDSVNSSSSKKPSDAAAKVREDENRYALEVTSKEHKKEATIPLLLESLASQESLIESLKSLNVDSEKTRTSLTELIHEKDQALVEIACVYDMNECFNRDIMAHARKKHQEATRVARTKHEQENTKLLESLASQKGLINSLKSLNIEPAQTICSLMHLISEKDTALAAMSHFNDMNNCANRKAHANEKHQDGMREHKLRTKNLYSLMSLQLREKLVHQRELALIKLQMEDGGIEIMNRQYIEEVKFVLAALAMVAVLMALVWKHEWFFFISPVYFLFLFWYLE